MRRITFTVILLLILSTSLSAQVAVSSGTPPPVRRDTQALTAVQAAIAALGGATAIGQVHSWQANAQVGRAAPDGTAINGTLVWEMSGKEFRMSHSIGAMSGYIVTGHGSPAAISNESTKTVPPHVIRALFVPALVGSVLLSEFQNPHYFIMYGGSKALGSEQVTVVLTGFASGDASARVTVQRWFFEQASGLPVRVEFRMPSEKSPLISITGSFDLSGYQTVSGASYPFHIVVSERGTQIEVVTLQSVNVNANIPTSDFDAPAGGAQ